VRTELSLNAVAIHSATEPPAICLLLNTGCLLVCVLFFSASSCVQCPSTNAHTVGITLTVSSGSTAKNWPSMLRTTLTNTAADASFSDIHTQGEVTSQTLRSRCDRRFVGRTRHKGWLGSRVVSVLDSGAEGPGFKSQP